MRITRYEHRSVPGVVSTTACFYQLEYRDWTVMRRFSEFKVLRARLMGEDRYKGLIFPLLPEGEGLLGGLFPQDSEEFYRMRMARLQSFLNRLLEIPFVQDDASLLAFFDQRTSFSGEAFGKVLECYEKLNSLNINKLRSLGKAYLRYSYSLLSREELPADIQNYDARIKELMGLQSRFATVLARLLALEDSYRGRTCPYQVAEAEVRSEEFQWMVRQACSALAVYDQMHNNCTWIKTLV